MTGTHILLLILGGIALLLWGCRMVRTGVMRAFGSRLMSLVGRWSENRFQAAAAGATVGTVLQSSTATALLVSPFVAQGAMRTSGALAVMLGADLGSALAAFAFSLGLSSAWPLFAFVGYVLHTGSGRNNVRIRNIGRILIGLGLLFLGLQFLSTEATDISSSTLVNGLLSAAVNEPALAILVGLMLTWITYSSIAVVLFTVALASGLGFSSDQLFPVILGVNIGAALPALTATFTEAPATRRTPIGNLIFRMGGVAIAFVAMKPAGSLIAQLGYSDATEIAIFHLGLNAALIPLCIGLIGPVGKLLEEWLPDVKDNNGIFGPKHLQRSLFQTPSAALGAAARETLRMGELIEQMLRDTMHILETGNRENEQAVSDAEDRLDTLNDSIKLYLTELMRDELTGEDIERAVEIVNYTTNLEHVGDIIYRNLLELANKKARNNVSFSEQGFAEISKMHSQVMDTLDLSLNVFMNGQPDSARVLVLRKSEVRTMELEGTEKHLDRLRAGAFETLATSSVHLDVIRDFKRINSHLASVAYPVLERAGELRSSRLKKKALGRARQ